MNSVAYVGMDVDKQKIAMALLEATAGKTRDLIVANEPQKVEHYFREALQEHDEVHACYEAGSCGFELYRQLTDLGVIVTVASPGSVPRKSGDRVKTDRRDARKLAKALRNGDLSAVYVPSVADEEARDYLRLYEDMKYDLNRANQRLLHFLLRHGTRWTEGRNWTDAHWRWLRRLEFDSSVARATYEEYLTQIVDLQEKCQRIGEEIERIADQDRYREQVQRLNKKFMRIVLRGRPSQIAATAVAREFAGFIWGAMVGKVA